MHIRLLQFSDETTGETCQQSVLHALQVYRWTVAGEDDLLAATEEMVEDMEEGVERLWRVHPFLYIINYQHVYRLIEIDEVVGRVMTHRVGELHLEQAGRHIQHPLLVIGLLAAHTDGIDQMSLTAARGTIDEEGVEGGLAGMLGDGEADGAWQLIRVALDEVLERLLRVELRVELLGHGGIKDRRCLIATVSGLRHVYGGAVALNILRDLMDLVGHDTVTQPDIFAEDSCEYLTQQAHVVLLQVLVDVRAWNLHQEFVLRLGVGLQDDGCKPRFKLLLGNVCLDQTKAFVPKRLMTILHSAITSN